MSTHEADPRIARLLKRNEARWNRVFQAERDNGIEVGNRNLFDVLEEHGIWGPRPSFETVLAPLCDAFYLGNREKRLRIFRCVHREGHERILSAMAVMPAIAAERIRSATSRKKKERWMRRGLTAFVIENMAIDGRDSVCALDELHSAVEEHGLPQNMYRKVAKKDLRIKPKGAMTGWTVQRMLLGTDAE